MTKRTPRRRPRTAARSPDHGQPPVTNPALRAAILEVVDNQLAMGEPPEVRATLERLVAAGYTREGARELLAYVVTHEIFEVMSQGKPYNAARYRAALLRLPHFNEEDYASGK